MFDKAYRDCLHQLEQNRFVERLWSKDPSLWSPDPSIQNAIAQRLGWLESPHTMRSHVAALNEFTAEAKKRGFGRALLIGMGGSSLAPEIFARNRPLDILDTTNPDQIRATDRRPSDVPALYFVSSKSGTTLEVDALYRFLQSKAQPNDAFVAITDPGSQLDRLANEAGFWKTFPGSADIGGRFSALSFFGLAPAAWAGWNIAQLLDRAEEAVDACRDPDPIRNPGLRLGATLGALVQTGSDLLLPVDPSESHLGPWIEQLVAESSGKNGCGLLPVLPSETQERPTGSDLGHSFFVWEVATAALGTLLGINPFDEPNVQESKELTRRVLDDYRRNHRIERDLPILETDRALFFGDDRLRANHEADAASLVRAHFDRCRPDDYVAVLAFSRYDVTPRLQKLCERIRRITKRPVTLGFGPRYLHSTGQFHKGGPSRGLFVMLTAEAKDDLPVPGEPYTFGILERAQAIGDFSALTRRGKPILRIHSRSEITGALALLEEALSTS